MEEKASFSVSEDARLAADAEGGGSAAMQVTVSAASGGGSKVREASSGRYVFKPFAKQLEDSLAAPQVAAELSLLDLLHLQRKRQPLTWKRGLLDKEEREKQRRRIGEKNRSFSLKGLPESPPPRSPLKAD